MYPTAYHRVILFADEWMTPEFLEKFEKDPELQSVVNDPGFIEAIGYAYKDPQQLVALMSARPEWEKPLKRVLMIFAEHFEKLGEKQELEKNMAQLPENEKQLVNSVMADPELQV